VSALFFLFAVPPAARRTLTAVSSRFAHPTKTTGGILMFKQDSDYALNKHSPNIVYRLADGSCLEVRPEDCPDFNLWKALSDEDYHQQELHDRRVTRNDLPLDEDICGCADNPFEDKPPCLCTMENAMAILEQRLTEIQQRRYLLHTCAGKSTRQIAQTEGVS
jgi:hypothetical protein